MPRTCTVCAHPEREAIDKALASENGYRTLSDRYGLSKQALMRHKAEHLPASLTQAQAAAEVVQADNLLAEMQRLQKVTMGLLGRAVQDGDNRTALMAVSQARGNIELLGRLLGELQAQAANVNIVVLPEWLGLRTRILAALAAYPDARLAVAEALNGDGGQFGTSTKSWDT